MSLDRRTAALENIDLTPAQTRALKLAKAGDLHPNGQNGWTHKDAVVTYARTDRFKERPRKVVVVTGKTVDELREHGFLRATGSPSDTDCPHAITMPGKIWLLTNK